MCDYSLHHVQSRPAKVGDKLTTRDFRLRHPRIAAAEERASRCAGHRGLSCLCSEVKCVFSTFVWSEGVSSRKTAILRRVIKRQWRNHNALNSGRPIFC